MSKITIEKLKASAFIGLQKLQQEVRREQEDLKEQLHVLKLDVKKEWQDIERALRQFSKCSRDAKSEFEKYSEQGVSNVKQLRKWIQKLLKRYRNW